MPANPKMRPVPPAIAPARLAMLAGCAVSLAAPVVMAAPRGEQVVRGSAQFSRQGDTTIIRAANKTIINYQSFDIGRGETVRFVQPGANARVLNRIDGAAPTRIDGALLANGRVYIVNPAGVMFGANSIVNVATLYAGAANIADADFLRGVNHFTEVSGLVINEGLITADAVHLIGQRVANHGAIVADGGVVTMLVGNDVLIGEKGGSLFVRIDGESVDAATRPSGASGSATPIGPGEPGVENSGLISAPRGRVTLGAGDTFSLAVRNRGDIKAAGGRIDLAAGGAVHNAGSLDTSVAAGRAGVVAISGDSVIHDGAASADAQSGRAGEVIIHSAHGTTIAESASISAAGGDGKASGGAVLVHAYHGDTTFSPGATLDISGGAQGGHGGFAEVSAAAGLNVEGVIKGDALAGYRPAAVLFDPLDIVISSGPEFPAGAASDGVVNSGDGAPGDIFRIAPATIEGFSGDVFLAATRDILAGESIDKLNGGLTLVAGRDILFAGEFGGFIPDLTISADFLNFTAGRNIVDRSLRATKLVSTTGDISLEATTGVIDFGLAVAMTNNRTIRMTQASNMFIGAGPFGVIGNRQNTNLVVNVTNGWLIFGGEFGGASGEDPGNEQRLRSVSATARQFLRVQDNMIIGQSATLRSQGDVEINGYVHAGGAIALHAGLDGSGMVQFLSPGLDLAASAITLRAGNNAGLAAASVDAVTNDPTFRGAALGATRPDSFTLQQDAEVANAGLPAAAQFAAPIAGINYRIESNDAGVTVADDARVSGSALTLASETGSNLDAALSLLSLVVFNSASINGGAVTSTGDQTYHGPVTLGAGAMLTGEEVEFNGTLDGPHDLAIDADVVFAGAVGATEPLASLAIDGTAAINGGEITTTGGQDYTGPVTLGADTAVKSLAEGVLRFGSTIDGPHDLFITTTPAGLIVFGGDVGAGAGLHELRLSTAGAGGSRDIPVKATIIGERTLSFSVTRFVMGAHEKFTALGALTVNALDAAFLGDLVTQGDMRVIAPTITLLCRQAHDILTSAGALVADRGLDFMSGGVIDFSGSIVLGGEPGAPAPTFGSAATGVAPSNLDMFEFKQIDPALVASGSLMLNGQVLDQRTSAGGGPPPPSDDDDASPVLAEAGNPFSPQFEDSIRLEVYNIDSLRRIAVAARDVSADEAIGGVSGRVLFNDMPPTISGFTEGDLHTVATRFDVDEVARVVMTYDELFGAGPTSNVAEIAASLRQAGDAYLTLSQAAAVDAEPFIGFLESEPAHADALAYVERLRSLMADLRSLPLTPVEYRQSRDRILATIAPSAGLGMETLTRMVEPQPATSPDPVSGVTTPRPSQPGT